MSKRPREKLCTIFECTYTITRTILSIAVKENSRKEKKNSNFSNSEFAYFTVAPVVNFSRSIFQLERSRIQGTCTFCSGGGVTWKINPLGQVDITLPRTFWHSFGIFSIFQKLSWVRMDFLRWRILEAMLLSAKDASLFKKQKTKKNFIFGIWGEAPNQCSSGLAGLHRKGLVRYPKRWTVRNKTNETKKCSIRWKVGHQYVK